ncbi:MAG: asparagine synthase (glutamine-hydrolyzing), partial [Candidatus Eremiobacteraeota bacterium]|nr:asparagine synthase (glutamine-hydrolyzing) [Candidatus Eremiobacteraeota bacterium]
MCGICGLISRKLAGEALVNTIERMTQLLAHRGPDDNGVWQENGVALGHRRLSILDLSALGHQPMASPTGRWIVTYNGEIYNFQELRQQLQGHQLQFRGGSDTEVLVAACENWGIEKTLSRLRGMFAFAAWDRQQRKLVLARDRLGQKPLYYGFLDEQFVFASELGVVSALSARPSLDRDAVAMMLRYNCIPAPHTIYKGFQKLPPACAVEFHPDSWSLSQVIDYWQPPTAIPSDSLCSEEALERTLHRLSEAVRCRLVSDVPLGAFLSGGIDSSLVVALMQRNSPRPIRTFTIGFADSLFNEAEQAAAVASHLGTDHTELYVTPKDALDIVPNLGRLYDEPFADASQIPTLLISRLTRQHVTVALSGDGGDEFFGGYNRHVWLTQVGHRLTRLPQWLREGVARLLQWPWLGRSLDALARRGLVSIRTPSDKLSKFAS